MRIAATSVRYASNYLSGITVNGRYSSYNLNKITTYLKLCGESAKEFWRIKS